MANRQIDPDGPYMRGYADAELGLPFEGHPYLSEAQRREYRNGYDTAKRAEREPSA